MQGLRIKWGNIFIFLLIIAAGVAAFYYKSPDSFKWLPKVDLNKVLDNTGNDSDKKTETKNNNNQDTGSGSGNFTFGLDSWIGGTPALAAVNRGYDRDYSLQMKLKFIPNDADRIQELKSGKIQATEMSLPAFIGLNEKYPDAGIIAGITDFSRGADGVVAGTGVKTLNDMEGKRISFVSDGTGKFILNKFLRLTGLRYQDITPIERKSMSEVVSDFKTGKADLVVSWSPDMNLLVKEMNAARPNTVKLLITTKEVPDLVPTVLLINKAVLEKEPAKAANFIRAWYASSKYILERPDTAYEKLVQLMKENKDEYGEVTSADVRESFSNIKLMSLNDTFAYFGVNAKEKTLENIIKDTAQTWKKYGGINSENISGNIVNYSIMETLFKENDKELLVSSVEGAKQQPAETAQQFKKQDEASIEKNTEQVAKVDMPPVFYDSGKATVKAESLQVLNEVINVLKQFPQYYLIVDAHTDSSGSDDLNLKLSKDRADEVKNYLVNQGAINPNRVVARGWGETRLVVQNEQTEADMAKNRRTEFILTREVK